VSVKKGVVLPSEAPQKADLPPIVSPQIVAQRLLDRAALRSIPL
jgi:hypothetical protein